MTRFRAATEKDLAGIATIYNDAVAHTTATFDTEPRTLERQKLWFAAHGPTHPVWVAEEEGQVIGWASLSRWSERAAYDSTAEVSLYIRADRRGRGIGKTLLKTVLEEGRKAGLHSVLARITEGNEISVKMHLAEGFNRVGTLREVGCKFGLFLDVHVLQLLY